MGDDRAGGKTAGSAGQKAAALKQVDLSQTYQYTEKNTFLSIVDTQDGWSFLRRPKSAPPSNTASDDASISSDRGSRSSSTLANMDLLLQPSGPKGAADDGDVDSLSDEDAGGEGGDAVPGSGGEALPVKKENRRPCKNQRERYRKLVMRLEEQVKADPFGFKFENCQLPPSVTGDAKLRSKLQKRLEQFAEGLQNQMRAGPLGSAANQPAGAPGVVAQRQQMEPGMPSTSAFYAPGTSSGSGAASSLNPPGASSGFGPPSSRWVGVMKLSL